MPILRRFRQIPILFSILLGVNTPALPWGHDGHRIVARVAAKNLTPDARKKLAAILGTNDAGLEDAFAAASTWPDEINKATTRTSSWHFVNIPITGQFDVGTFCDLHNCVIDRFQEMSDRLRLNQQGFKVPGNPTPVRPMTSQELAFLIHFAGDVHQPLHSSNNADRGGNCELLAHSISHPDGSRTTELHAVWDNDEVFAVMKELGDENATAAALFQQFKDGTAVDQLTASDWAHEANDLARSGVYQKINIPLYTAPAGQCATDIAKVSVDQTYLDGNMKDTELQLIRAGIRLSNVLNDICTGRGCQAKPKGKKRLATFE